MKASITNVSLSAWLAADAVMIAHALERFESWIIEVPYLLGLLIQIWFVLTRPSAISADIRVSTIAVVVLSVLVPHAYTYAPPVPLTRAWIVTALGCGSALLFLWSAITLGRCFSVLPAARHVVTGGPYRYCGHPIYLSYVLLDLGLVLALTGWEWGLVWVVEVSIFRWRAILEERLFHREFPDYTKYRDQQRFSVFRRAP